MIADFACRLPIETMRPENAPIKNQGLAIGNSSSPHPTLSPQGEGFDALNILCSLTPGLLTCLDWPIRLLRKINVTVPGSHRWIRQQSTTGSHVNLVSPIVVPKDFCSFI